MIPMLTYFLTHLLIGLIISVIALFIAIRYIKKQPKEIIR